METDRVPCSISEGSDYVLTLSNIQERNIDILCQVAKSNGTSLSLMELADLTSLDVREEELEKAWNRSKVLSDRYKIAYGRITERVSSIKEADMRERYLRYVWNLGFAKKFALLFTNDEDLKVLSISGSTAYHSVSDQDDLDFFCVTRNDSLWIFLLKALIRSRRFQAREKGPPLCFSYVVEEASARKLFSKGGDGLFARDAITVNVLKGQKLYGNLLLENAWIGFYFPKMYRARVSELLANKREGYENSFSDDSSIVRKIANRLLEHTLGNYIRVKSYLLNRRFAKAKENKRIFKVKINNGSCLFESNDYLELRKKYVDFI